MKDRTALQIVGDAIDGVANGEFDRDAALKRGQDAIAKARAEAQADSRKAFAWGVGAGVLLTLIAYASWSLA